MSVHKWTYFFFRILISIMIWSLGNILVQVAKNPILFNLGGKILFTGIVMVPYFWFMFAISYTDNDDWLNLRRKILGSIIPVLTLIIMYVDALSPLMREVTSIIPNGVLITYTVKYGPWFWVHGFSSYSMLVIGLVLLLRSVIGSSKIDVTQKILLAIAFTVPTIMNFLYVIGITGNVDYTTSGFTFLALVVAINFSKFKFLDIGPIARGIVFEHMDDPIIVLDLENRINEINIAAVLWAEKKKQELLGMKFSTLFPEFTFLLEESQDVDEYKKDIGIPAESPIHVYTVQINAIKNQRQQLVGRVIVLRNIDQQEKAKQNLLQMNYELDSRVSKRTAELQDELQRNQKIQRALLKSEERYALAIQGANDGIWDWDIDSGTVFFSPRWKSMLGYADDEIGPTIDSWLDNVHEDDRGFLQIELSRHLEGQISHFECSHRMRCKDDTYLWVRSRGMAKPGHDGIASRMSGSMTDISQQKQYEEQILFNAYHDQLTGLPNRTFIMDRISHSIERAKRSADELFALIFLDLDRFKNVNDSLGHNIGDELLKVIAQRLKESLRTIDTLCRWGGDEFVILIDSLDSEDEIKIVADRIISVLSKTVCLEGNEMSVGASLGIVIFSDQYANAGAILRDADIAMYQAKTNSFRRYEIFTTEMRIRAEQRLKLETEIRHAIQANEFELYYQPILSVDDLSLVSFEALIRWHKSGEDNIEPDAFIPVAEETGLIIPIGDWVLRETCRQIAVWKKAAPPEKTISVSVNISAKQFSDPELGKRILSIMDQYGVEGKNLIVEITESVLIEQTGNVDSIITMMREAGIEIHIDDFGTGYSSLSYLHSLPFDVLKIDRSFVRQMLASGDSQGKEIVHTIISLGKELKKKVIAEGVETQQELEMLKEMGCGYFQGYFISTPVKGNQASQFLAQNFLLPRSIIIK